LTQALIRRATVRDAAKRTGYPAGEIMEMLHEIVREHIE